METIFVIKGLYDPEAETIELDFSDVPKDPAARTIFAEALKEARDILISRYFH